MIKGLCVDSTRALWASFCFRFSYSAAVIYTIYSIFVIPCSVSQSVCVCVCAPACTRARVYVCVCVCEDSIRGRPIQIHDGGTWAGVACKVRQVVSLSYVSIRSRIVSLPSLFASSVQSKLFFNFSIFVFVFVCFAFFS